MNKKILIISLVTILFGGKSMLLGQTGCGTYISNSQKALESTISIAQNTPLTQSLPQINRTLCINVYVVKAQDGTSFDVTKVATAINDLNQTYFNPIGLSFKTCTIKYINNYQFDHLDANNNEKNLLTQYSEPNIINLYLVTDITDMNGTPSYGFTYMPGDSAMNYIFMAKSSFNGVNLAHQMGHFFNLYHTNETIFGLELPDESNCSSTGDRCCDTDASPDLSLPQMVTSCIYSGTVKRSTQVFNPSTKNLMALSDATCRCFFSRTQFLRMENILNSTKRNYLR